MTLADRLALNVLGGPLEECGTDPMTGFYRDGAAAPVVLASTHERALDVIPLKALQENAIDVPADPGNLI